MDSILHTRSWWCYLLSGWHFNHWCNYGGALDQFVECPQKAARMWNPTSERELQLLEGKCGVPKPQGRCRGIKWQIEQAAGDHSCTSPSKSARVTLIPWPLKLLWTFYPQPLFNSTLCMHYFIRTPNGSLGLMHPEWKWKEVSSSGERGIVLEFGIKQFHTYLYDHSFTYDYHRPQTTYCNFGAEKGHPTLGHCTVSAMVILLSP